MFCIPDQAKRSRIEVVRHGMIFQHPVVAPLGSPGVPLQQLMPTAQGRSAAVVYFSRPGSTTLVSVGLETLLEVRGQPREFSVMTPFPTLLFVIDFILFLIFLT